MRRWIAVVSLFLIACRAVSLVASNLSPSTPSTPTLIAPLARTPTVSPAATNTPVPAASPSPLAPAAPVSTVLPESNAFSLRLHPDGPLYVGDQVSFEIIAPPQANLEGHSARVQLIDPAGSLNAEAGFGHYGIGGRIQANLIWAWDTSQLSAGEYTLQVTIQPDGPSWSETVILLPRGQLPPPESQARWATVSTPCCTVHYITETPAERDLQTLLTMLDEQVNRASKRMGVQLTEPIQVVWLPRVLGHGGFASKEIALSYLDRNYMAGDVATILHHEIIHILDSRLGGELKPSAFVEGLAVYLSGGHFKPEPILPRAAALLPPAPGCVAWDEARSSAAESGCGVGGYIPLRKLIDNFYFEQHEIGYLEAAALIEFMVNTWGWQSFSAFYRDIHPQKSEQPTPSVQAQSDAVEAALEKHFGLSLAQLEQRFQAALREQPLSPEIAEDLRLSISFYDTARRYQLLLDPSAHFLTAWLMDSEQMRKRGIVADYLRRPGQPEGLALETMLAAAGESLGRAEFADAAKLLQAINQTLDLYPQQGIQAFEASPLASDHLALVQAALAAGYQPERIHLEGNTARMWVSTSGPELSELQFTRNQEIWVLSGMSGWRFYPDLDLSLYGQLHRTPLSALNGGWQ
jgi:hypothetical protein